MSFIEDFWDTYDWCRTYRKGSRFRALVETIVFEIRSRLFEYAELEENKVREQRPEPPAEEGSK